MTQASQIAIIIVTFHPSDSDLAFISHIRELYATIVIDNTVENKGIAEAQNEGLRQVMALEEVTHIVFLDQDSRVADDYPLAIAREFDRIAKSQRLAILGPSIENTETGKEYKSVVHKDNRMDAGFIPRREIISSGSCTTVDSLKAIGLNDAGLFIDYVDFEWCWRAKSKGYVCGITPNLSISHHVGRKTISLFGYMIIISAPQRYFYQYRNYLWLAHRKYVPLQWKIATGIKLAARLIYFPLCIRSGYKCWKQMLKGIKAGLKL